MSKNIVFFTGAGVSAESGISTFRDSGGLWENYRVEDICTAGCLDTNRDETVEFYNKRRADIKDKEPNKAHQIISKLKNQYPDKIQVVTQNVDDMFERADCKDVLHLHGFLPEVRCENEQCGATYNIDYEEQDKFCPKCGEYLRPNIVFFGEAAPKYKDLHNIISQKIDLMVIIGTSGYVINVHQLITNAKYSILNNLEASDAIVDNYFDEVIYDKATNSIDKIEQKVLEILNS